MAVRQRKRLTLRCCSANEATSSPWIDSSPFSSSRTPWASATARSNSWFTPTQVMCKFLNVKKNLLFVWGTNLILKTYSTCDHTCSRIEGCAVTVESRALNVEEETASCPCTKECTDSNCDVYRAFNVWSFTFNCSTACVKSHPNYYWRNREWEIRCRTGDAKIFYTSNLTTLIESYERAV